MGDVIVTDTNTPAAGNDQILIVRPYNGTPTPTSRLKPDTYYSFKNTWYKLFQPIYEALKAYVPITRTITINGDTKDLSSNREWTVTAATPTLEEVLTEGNNGGGLQIKNIATPTSDMDAATKVYVDNLVVYPAGSDTQVQFNDAGDFGSDSTLTFNKTTKLLTAQAANISGQTASRIAIFDSSKNVVSADTATYPSLTELSYVKGVTSAIQTQLDSKCFFVNAGAFATISASTTSYGWIDTIGSLNATEALRQNIITIACTMSNFAIKVGAQPASGSLVITLRKNGADTTATITIAAGSGAGTYSGVGSETFAVNDLAGWKYVNNASSSTGTLYALGGKVTPL